jgi:hypothetical protein
MNAPTDRHEPTSPTAGEARDLLERSGAAKRALRAEADWVVSYLTVFGVAALVLVPLGAFIDQWPVFAAVNLAWMVLLVAMPVWAARRKATLRGAGPWLGVAFLLFGVLYAVTAFVGFTRFPGDFWWWLIGGVASAAPLLLTAWWQARR